jgi:hypothetical protein
MVLLALLISGKGARISVSKPHSVKLFLRPWRGVDLIYQRYAALVLKKKVVLSLSLVDYAPHREIYERLGISALDGGE